MVFLVKWGFNGFFEKFIKSKNIDLESQLPWYLFRSEGLKFLV